MPPDIIQLLIDGQKRLFEILDEVRTEVKNIGVQNNEIAHINKTLLELKETDEDHEKRIGTVEVSCIKNHSLPERREMTETPPPAPVEKHFGRRLAEACIMTVVVGAVGILCSILGFTMFVNTQSFFDFQHSQIEKKTSFPQIPIAPSHK